MKETPSNESTKMRPQLNKLTKSSSFNQGLANWHAKARMKWDRDRGTSPTATKKPVAHQNVSESNCSLRTLKGERKQTTSFKNKIFL